MSAFFGIDAQSSKNFFPQGVVCLDENKESGSLAAFRTVRSDDVIFIKSFFPQTGICVKAIGIVLPGNFRESGREICMPVDWCWKGDAIIEINDETYNHCGDQLYEEHNIWIQKQLNDMLPAKYQLPAEW